MKLAKKLPQGLLKEPEMETLLDDLSRFDEPPHLKAALARYRLHVVAELMYATGLRVSEVASLTVGDIDFAAAPFGCGKAKAATSVWRFSLSSPARYFGSTWNSLRAWPPPRA